ncbi:MAG TPA: hypothetical protein VLK27_11670 [Chthoniobacterales bacterium]|nr:hypothetical protein [Chthoniobacterales bacterium]
MARTLLVATVVIFVVIIPSFPRRVLAQTTGLPTYNAAEAAKHIGELATVADKIVAAYKTQNGDILLVMGGKFPKQTFTIGIQQNGAWKFSDYHKYKGQMVAVFGKITLYLGKPEITVTTRTQFVLR